jgi:hypothetical protein
MDGQLCDKNSVPEGLGWQADDDDLIHIIPTAAGTDVLQKVFDDATASDVPMRWHFTMRVQSVDEDEHFRLHRALAKRAAVYFVPGIWLEEVFSNVVNGSVRSLTRPLAEDIHPDVSFATHPYRFFDDDVENASAAAISGSPKQIVTSAVTSNFLAVRYMPAFRVVERPFPRRSRGSMTSRPRLLCTRL